MLAALTVAVVLAAAALAAAVVLVGGWWDAHRVAIARRAARWAPSTEILRRSRRRGLFVRVRLRPGGVFGLELIAGFALVMALGSAVGAVLEDVTHGEGVAVIDHPVARFVAARRTRGLSSFMHAVSLIGGPVGIGVIAMCAAIAFCAARRRWAPLCMVAVCVAGISVIDVVFKAAVGRSRPPLAQAVDTATGYAFPSGHAASATAILAVLAYVLTQGVRSAPVRAATWAVAAAVAAVVSASRVYLGVHWVSDVVGGMLVGALWAVIVTATWRTYGRTAAERRASREHRARMRR